MTVKNGLLMSVIFGLALGVVVAMFADVWDSERIFIEHVYEPARPAEAELPPADVSALMEEARRITRSAVDG